MYSFIVAKQNIHLGTGVYSLARRGHGGRVVWLIGTLLPGILRGKLNPEKGVRCVGLDIFRTPTKARLFPRIKTYVDRMECKRVKWMTNNQIML